jgi:HlyD family secretion protein
MRALFADAPSELHEPETSILRPVAIGLSLLGLFIGGFGVWAATAPLKGAVVAPGQFVVTGQNKVVQHLEGGIIRSIHVREGDRVTTGQTLVSLEATNAGAQRSRLLIRKARLLAHKSRLSAERLGVAALAFPPELRAMSDIAEVREAMLGQEAEFKARLDKLVNERLILAQQTDATRNEIVGLTEQRRATAEQLRSIKLELADYESLFAKGLAPKSRVAAIQRQEAKLVGDQGDLDARIARTRERISELDSQKANLDLKRIEEAAQGLRSVDADLDDIEQQIRAASDVVQRLEVKAPVAGTIVKLHHHTTGGVVSAGQALIEIVPVGEQQVAEVCVRPEDIQSVKKSVDAGGKASVRLVAVKGRTTPTVLGTVVYVSDDTVESTRRRGEFCFMARIMLDEGEAARVPGFVPVSGMPVETQIQTGERTFLDYVVEPIVGAFNRAFLEP